MSTSTLFEFFVFLVCVHLCAAAPLSDLLNCTSDTNANPASALIASALPRAVQRTLFSSTNLALATPWHLMVKGGTPNPTTEPDTQVYSGIYYILITLVCFCICFQ